MRGRITQGQAREGEERGKGTPLEDIERVMRHYNIDRATAEYWLTIHPLDILLPERGTGLITQGTSPSWLPAAILGGCILLASIIGAKALAR